MCLVSIGALGWLAFETTRERQQPPLTQVDPSPAFTKDVQEQMAPQGKTSPSAAQTATVAAEDELPSKLAALEASQTVVPGELLLSFRSPEALAAFRIRAGLVGIEILHSDARLRSARVRYRDRTKMASELSEYAADYENIGPNHLLWVPGTPPAPKDANNAGGNVPFESSGLAMIGAERAERERWGAGIKVAVLDTGITEHPSLAGVKITHKDLVQDRQPYDGHGTAMATLIAGRDAGNGGVAPASELMDYRVADATGVANVGLVAQGILQAVDAGARIINISLGTSADSRMLRDAVAYAISRGVVVVAAAGNEQATRLAYPAGYEGVISVAAVDAQGRQAYFSNAGDGLFISAPGVGIVSGYRDGKTVIGSGTSQAAAIVSGAISALLSRNYQAGSIRQVLSRHAQPTGAPSTQTGVGVLHLP
ncbi:MAG: S8 family serine peptidase [Prosthecobacter sp.]|nr:S8 family serine peptidase [Prosthecobacter sp.]